jgi:hypothetical protein
MNPILRVFHVEPQMAYSPNLLQRLLKKKYEQRSKRQSGWYAEGSRPLTGPGSWPYTVLGKDG